MPSPDTHDPSSYHSHVYSLSYHVCSVAHQPAIPVDDCAGFLRRSNSVVGELDFRDPIQSESEGLRFTDEVGLVSIVLFFLGMKEKQLVRLLPLCQR